MTKKHFIALANMMRGIDSNYAVDHDTWRIVRDALADFCAAQNSQFNRECWLGYIAGTNGPNGKKL